MQEAKPTQPDLLPLEAFEGALSNRVYLSLKAAIMELGYRPGQILRKADICGALGVSRSPVSEAVARLAGEGLVNVVPQAGTYVARFSMAEIREGAFLREALELATIELLAQTITDAQLVQLRRNLRLQEGLVADGDAAGFNAADWDMHEMLMSFTGFRRLGQWAQTSWVQVNRARHLLLPHPGRIEATLVEHRAVIDALEARDVEAARSAMRHHLAQLIKLLEPLERTRPDLFDAP